MVHISLGENTILGGANGCTLVLRAAGKAKAVGTTTPQAVIKYGSDPGGCAGGATPWQGEREAISVQLLHVQPDVSGEGREVLATQDNHVKATNIYIPAESLSPATRYVCYTCTSRAHPYFGRFSAGHQFYLPGRFQDAYCIIWCFLARTPPHFFLACSSRNPMNAS